MKTSAAARRSAFTLVELLVVVGILAVLAALLSAAVANALRAAKEAAIKVDIDGLDMALKAYKSEFGSYPPNWNNTALVRRHLMKRFPRIAAAELTAVVNANLAPSEALVFWLEGVGPDPARPFSFLPTGSQAQARFEFDKSRLVASRTTNPTPTTVNINGRSYPLRHYVPPQVSVPAVSRQPYIYFNSANEYTNGAMMPTVISFTNPQTGVFGHYPYYDDKLLDATVPATYTPPAGVATPGPFVNPDSFQVLCAGLDDNWGSANRCGFPVGDGYATGDRDNLANFFPKPLEDAIP